MEKDGNAIRVNKDLVRKMLHFDKWSGKNESITRDVVRGIVKSLLTEKYDNTPGVVIVDDTNLNPGTLQSWKDLANELGVTYEVKKIETTWEECVKRDLERPNSVGKNVIIGMARQYGMYEFKNPEVICDMDGTLCDITHRLKHIKKEPKDWKAFFSNFALDKPRHEVIDQIRDLSKTHDIIMVSARPEDYRQETETWLVEHHVPFRHLIMRKANDKRDDDIVKKQILDNYFDKSKVAHVFDDRPRVLRVWREELPNAIIHDVGNGIEF
jgi:predicted kinase